MNFVSIDLMEPSAASGIDSIAFAQIRGHLLKEIGLLVGCIFDEGYGY